MNRSNLLAFLFLLVSIALFFRFQKGPQPQEPPNVAKFRLELGAVLHRVLPEVALKEIDCTHPDGLRVICRLDKSEPSQLDTLIRVSEFLAIENRLAIYQLLQLQNNSVGWLRYVDLPYEQKGSHEIQQLAQSKVDVMAGNNGLAVAVRRGAETRLTVLLGRAVPSEKYDFNGVLTRRIQQALNSKQAIDLIRL